MDPILVFPLLYVSVKTFFAKEENISKNESFPLDG